MRNLFATALKKSEIHAFIRQRISTPSDISPMAIERVISSLPRRKKLDSRKRNRGSDTDQQPRHRGVVARLRVLRDGLIFQLSGPMMNSGWLNLSPESLSRLITR
jgi:hypothetical protein